VKFVHFETRSEYVSRLRVFLKNTSHKQHFHGDKVKATDNFCALTCLRVYFDFINYVNYFTIITIHIILSPSSVLRTEMTKHRFQVIADYSSNFR